MLDLKKYPYQKNILKWQNITNTIYEKGSHREKTIITGPDGMEWGETKWEGMKAVGIALHESD